MAQAYNIDKKIDDGLPQSGNVTAFLKTYVSAWVGVPPGGSASGSATTCYDGGGSGAMQYSMEINNGSNPNCALSFKMQGAAR